MPRPKCCRRIIGIPHNNYFKPKGIPSTLLEEVILTLDEYEAIRLADFEGLYQEQAAVKMNVSRQTFGRIIELAHKKIADVIINGKALKIEGGEISIEEAKSIECHCCHKSFNPLQSSRETMICPYCREKK